MCPYIIFECELTTDHLNVFTFDYSHFRFSKDPKRSRRHCSYPTSTPTQVSSTSRTIENNYETIYTLIYFGISVVLYVKKPRYFVEK